MFSSRLNWSYPRDSLDELRVARAAAGQRILELTASNPAEVGLDPSGVELAAALAHDGVNLHRPSPQGELVAREAIARYYGQHDRSIEPSSIYLTASTSEAYSFLFRLLCDGGDEVLVPRPGYPLFDFLTALDLVRPVAYPLRLRTRWQLHLERLEAVIGPRTRAIIVVSPHNPTGHCLVQAERDALVDLCVRHDLALIVDEVFLDYVDAPPPSYAGSLSDETRALTFVISGLSKVVALPQVKLGWIQISGPPALVAEAARRLEWIADTYLSVSAAAQLATAPLLERRTAMSDQVAERMTANLDQLRAVCDGLQRVRVLAREAGWYALLQCDGIDAERFAFELLERDGVFVHPGRFYDLDDESLIVLSLLTPPALFAAGITRVLSRLP